MKHIIKVMIAEDIDILRENFAQIVDEQEDMEVVGTASSGQAIVQMVETVVPDVILMDIEMDKRHDGIEAADEILTYTQGVRVVFLTVHEDDETVFKAFEAGAVDYVIKSLPEEIIIQSIRQAYENQSIIRSEIAQKIRNEFTRLKKNEASLLLVIDIISKLTPSEFEIIRLLLLNMTVADIAKARFVTVSTIKSQINMLLKKFDRKRTKEILVLIRELKLTYFFEEEK